ncbi:MAG: hypothetical protein ACR2P5_04065 [Gammaproteobacteria bacterium]
MHKKPRQNAAQKIRTNKKPARCFGKIKSAGLKTGAARFFPKRQNAGRGKFPFLQKAKFQRRAAAEICYNAKP